VDLHQTNIDRDRDHEYIQFFRLDFYNILDDLSAFSLRSGVSARCFLPPSDLLIMQILYILAGISALVFSLSFWQFLRLSVRNISAKQLAS
jgi:hypothetical protein